MTSIELVKQILKRIKKFSWLIAIVAALVGGLFYYISKKGIILYTSKATVFPLNSSNDNSISSSAISNILGLAESPRSFSSEASINIVELASSRRTREAVALTKIPSLQNKSVAQLLIDENNSRTGFMQNETIVKPKDSLALINRASDLLKLNFTSKINKNGILELYFTNSNQDIVREVSYIFIDKISEFYVDLKRKKARIDFEFSVTKADSLKAVLDKLDRESIRLDETTFFTNDQLLRYSLPKANKAQDKQTVQSQYYYAVNNREAAAYKLQKATPVIEKLDKPEPPFTDNKKSTAMYIFFGVVIGLVLGMLLVSWKVINKYLGHELEKAIDKASKVPEENISK
jgi:hypothetical protein